jgi:xylono-1,5-lactonase
MEVEWEVAVDGYSRLEAPCLDAEGRLCFAERLPPGAVLRVEPDGSVTELARSEHVGGLLPHAGGGLVVSARTVFVLEEDGRQRCVRQPVGGWGFNDMTTDSAGNVFVGMHGERPTGQPPSITASLWRLGSDGSAMRCYDGIQLTNGLAISPDGSRLYHNDTTPRTVWVSDLDSEGLPHNRRVFFRMDGDGSPDGMAIDESGCVWIAAIAAGEILRLTPHGQQDLVLDAPAPYVASLCFGGSDLRDLYVVTFGGEPYDPGRTGGVYRTRMDIAGAGITPARL